MSKDHYLFDMTRRHRKDWTSGNELIDGFIQETKSNAKHDSEELEWIPYNKLKNIKFHEKGRFNIVYMATWSVRSKRKWIGYDYETVAIKNLNNSSDLSEEIINKVRSIRFYWLVNDFVSS